MHLLLLQKPLDWILEQSPKKPLWLRKPDAGPKVRKPAHGISRLSSELETSAEGHEVRARTTEEETFDELLPPPKATTYQGTLDKCQKLEVLIVVCGDIVNLMLATSIAPRFLTVDIVSTASALVGDPWDN
jgi:hypothetical protein